MIGAILQVRLHSSRLPLKALKRFGGRSIFEYCLEGMRRINADRWVVATEPRSYAWIARCAASYGVGVGVWVGSEADVLGRFLCAARAYGIRTVVRLTADNPFVSAEYANRALREFKAADCDYFHYTDLPLGGGVEVVGGGALTVAAACATSRYDREHVTPYIYNHSERFKVVHARCMARDYSDWRVTIDTEGDYQRMTRLFAHCNTPRPSLRRIIDAYPMLDA